MALKKAVEPAIGEMPPLARWAGAFLLAAAMFAVAAIMAFGSLGRESPWGWAFAALGVFCLIGWFAGRRRQLRAASAARDAQAKQRALLGINAFASVLILLVVLIGINYIAARRHKTFDLTRNRINSLAPQTYRALDKLPRPVKMIYVFAAAVGGQPNAQDAALLNHYKDASDKVSIDYVNAQVDQADFASLRLSTFSGAPMLLVEMAGAGRSTSGANGSTTARREVILIDEQNITSALLKLINPKPQILYFLTGHGELNPQQVTSPVSLSQARIALAAQNYTLRTLDLAQGSARVPADAAGLVVVAPRVDLSSGEEKKLRQYALNGGRCVLLLNPGPAPLPRWKNLLKSLGVELLGGFVDDPVQSPEASSQIIIGAVDVQRHPLLRGVSGHVVLPGVVPLLTTKPRGLTVTSLFESSPQSQIRPFPGTTLQARSGPFVLATTVERRTTEGAPSAPMRAVVVSNAVFATDQSFTAYGNGSFLTAAVNWAVGNDALVSIPPKPPVMNTIEISDAQRRFVVMLSLFAWPVMILLVGTVVWWKRR